ncbi:MAG: hypothetical protein PHQ98_04950 [Candidatus ainarchaeum sp.]|nr:hypothetical protein [Candidatus ainarchaeum sp.]
MPLKHLASPVISRVREFKTKRFFSHSKTFKELIRNNPKLFSSAFSLIQEIRAGKVRQAQNIRMGISVEKLEFAHTNRYNKNLFRVRTKDYEFFVKESVENYSKQEVEVWSRAEKYLEERGGGIMGYNVKLVKPHAMIGEYLVSNFYPIKEYTNIEGMPDSELKTELSEIVIQLGKNMSKFGVEDVRPRNALYHKATKTIYLVDLISRSRYLT